MNNGDGAMESTIPMMLMLLSLLASIETEALNLLRSHASASWYHSLPVKYHHFEITSIASNHSCHANPIHLPTP
jgi:hypothetical protein